MTLFVFLVHSWREQRWRVGSLDRVVSGDHDDVSKGHDTLLIFENQVATSSVWPGEGRRRGATIRRSGMLMEL